MFLAKQVCANKYPRFLVCLRKSSFLLPFCSIISQGTKFRMLGFFSQHRMYFTPLSSCLRGFWEVEYDTIFLPYRQIVFFPPASFRNISLSSIFCLCLSIKFLAFTLHGVSELRRSVAWCLSWVNSQSLLFQTCALFHSLSFLFVIFLHIYVYGCPTALGFSGFFFFLILFFAFGFGGFCWPIL